MPSTNAYQFRISLAVRDQEDGSPNDPVFEDSFSKRFSVTRVGASAGGGNPGTLVIPITDTAIVFTGLTRPAHLLLENLDSTNSVEYGAHASALAGAEIGELFPGQVDKVSLKNGATLRMRANTAPVRVLIKGYEF